MIGLNNLALQGYYSGIDALKSIQKSYKFLVTFWDDLTVFNPNKTALMEEIGSMPLIKFWHVLSISIPQYPFGKDNVQYGPIAKTFPVMQDFNGFDVRITFEEDEFGTIAYFINWLQRKIIDRDGMYRSQRDNRIDHLIIETQDDNGLPIQLYWYKNIYFQNVNEVTFDYGSPDSIKYDITFGADYLTFFPIKAAGVRIGTDELITRIQQGLGDFRDTTFGNGQNILKGKNVAAP